MKSIGKRIEELRKLESLSRPELGRRMAKAIGRDTPFSGEVVRLYEKGTHKPGHDARTALAKVFKRTEAYIEFGDEGATKIQQQETGPSYTASALEALSPQEQIMLHLFSGLFKLQRRKLVDEMYALYLANQITRKELGHKPLRGISDAEIEAEFGGVPAPQPKPQPKKKRDGGRDPGGAMSDYTEDP